MQSTCMTLCPPSSVAGCPELRGLGFDEAMQRQPGIGACCAISYLRRASAPPVRPVTVEVASLHRRGRGKGKGTGLLEVTGDGAEGMREFVKVGAVIEWAITQLATRRPSLTD